MFPCDLWSCLEVKHVHKSYDLIFKLSESVDPNSTDPSDIKLKFRKIAIAHISYLVAWRQCSVQKLRSISQLRRKVWTNDILPDLF